MNSNSMTRLAPRLRSLRDPFLSGDWLALRNGHDLLTSRLNSASKPQSPCAAKLGKTSSQRGVAIGFAGFPSCCGADRY
jgi:hypothetical protein